MASSRLDDLAPPTRARFGVLGFACSLSLLTYLDRVCITRAGADIKNEFGFSLEEMGYVFSSFTIGYTLFQMLGGGMGDKWGPRRILVLIVIAWSMFTALTGTIPAFSFDTGIHAAWLSTGTLFLNSFVLILVVRFLFGASEAGAYPNLARVTRDWFPVRERGFSLGAIWMSARIGGAIALFVIGRLAAHFGWRIAFFILGGTGLLWVIAFRSWFTNRPAQHSSCNLAEQRLIEPRASIEGVPELSETSPSPAAATPAITSRPVGVEGGTPLESRTDDHVKARMDESAAENRRHPSRSATPSIDLHRDGRSWPRFGLLIRSPNIWAMCFASFWVNFGWYFYPFWQPEYLKQVHGFEPEGMLSEILTGLPFLCGAIGAIGGGKLSDALIGLTGSRRWGRSMVGLFGFVGAGVCVLLTGWVTVWWHAVALLCLAFLINDLAIPPLWAAAGEVGGRFAGSVSGLMNMVGGFGAIISPILIPRVLTRLPEDFSTPQRWQWIFAGLAGAWFLAAAAWLFIDSSKPLEALETELSTGPR